MYHPSIVYQVYKLEQRLSRSEQRETDLRTGYMAEAIERTFQSLARALGWSEAKRARASAGPGFRSLKTSEVN
jgi:hypothetical protein